MDNRTEARIATLESEINRLKGLLTNESGDGEGTSSRRGMVKLMAVTAVGAVTGAAMLGAQPAFAADNDPAIVGNLNESSSPTIFMATGNSALVANSDVNFGIEAFGGAGNALFPVIGESPVLTPATTGTLFVDIDGNWWAATGPDFPAVWRQLASADSAGQLHLLPSPVRVYDSRPGADPASVQPKSPTAVNVPVSIDTTLGDTNGVPASANGVIVTLTIVAPQSGGFATVFPGPTIPNTSNINFVAGQNIATTAIVACGAGAAIQVLSNTVTDFIIDVSGYYQ